MSTLPTLSPSESIGETHDIFISYSRRDSDFVKILAQAIQNYTAPRSLHVKRRRLSLFLDKLDFQAGNYRERLDAYLKGSSKLIVICSPSARTSQYVNEEIRSFADLRGVQNVIPVLIRGIPNNEITVGSQQDAAFPEELCRLMEMPVAIDYRNFNAGRDRVTRGGFADPWFTLLAAIYDLSRAEVELREQRRRRKQQLFAAASVLAAAVVLILGLTVVMPRYRTQSAMAAVSRAGGNVDEKQGTVSVVFQSGAEAAEVDAALAQLRFLAKVDSLDLAESNFTTAGLAHLKDIRGLKQLTVASTNVGDAGMKEIEKPHDLKRLNLGDTKITAAELVHLNRFLSLERLTLSGLRLDRNVIVSLAAIPKLKALYIDRCELQDQDLSSLPLLAGLQELILSGNPVVGDGMRYLTGMTKLTTLELGDTPLTDSGMSAIGRLRSLQSLFLGGTKITNAGLIPIAGMPELRSLVLQGNERIQDSGVEQLGILPKLHEVWLKETSIGDGTMRYLAHQSTVQIIAAPVTKVTDAGMEPLADLPNLRELYLGGDNISDAGAASLLRIRSLRKLYLPTAQLTDKILPRFSLLRNLTELSVGGPGVTKLGFEKLKASMPRVKVLHDEAPSD